MDLSSMSLVHALNMCEIMEAKGLRHQVTKPLPAVLALPLPPGRVSDIHVDSGAQPIFVGTHVLLEEVPHNFCSPSDHE